MATYRPLEPRDHLFTQVDNYLLDYVMPVSPPNAWKILCFIVRKTKGWVDSETGTRKSRDRLSYSQIMKGTGIKHPKTVSTGIQFLVKEQYVLAFGSDDDWEANEYELNTQLEVELPATSKNEVDTASKSEVGSTSKNEDTKESGKKERKTTSCAKSAGQPLQESFLDEPLLVEKAALPKKPRKPDPILDIIVSAFNVPMGQAFLLKQQAMGRIPESKPNHLCNFSPPATAEELAAFPAWYQEQHPGMDLPLSPPKFQRHFYEMRQSRAKAEQAKAPKTRVSNGRELKFDRDMGQWFDIGPAPVQQPAPFVPPTNERATHGNARI